MQNPVKQTNIEQLYNETNNDNYNRKYEPLTRYLPKQNDGFNWAFGSSISIKKT